MDDIDDLQEAIDLNEEQKKAWKSLESAVKKCKKANIYFYHVMETLGALNGDNVEAIVVTECDLTYDRTKHNPDNSLDFLIFPTLQNSESFADDTHWIVLKEDYHG